MDDSDRGRDLHLLSDSLADPGWCTGTRLAAFFEALLAEEARRDEIATHAKQRDHQEDDTATEAWKAVEMDAETSDATSLRQHRATVEARETRLRQSLGLAEDRLRAEEEEKRRMLAQKRREAEAAEKRQRKAEQEEKERRRREQEEKEEEEAEAEAARRKKERMEEHDAREAQAEREKKEQQQQQGEQGEQGEPQKAGVAGKQTSAALHTAQGWIDRCRGTWDEMERLSAAWVSDERHSKRRRELSRTVNKTIAQITAVEGTVATKAETLIHLLRVETGDARPGEKSFVLVTVADRILTQCELQVSSTETFAFALAEVAVRVWSAVPELAFVLLGKMHAQCALSAPIWYTPATGGGTKEEAMRKNGMRAVESEAMGPKTMESADDYLRRARGFLLVWGALCASERNPVGHEQAWSYVARLVNGLTPTRASATALHAFLTHAGYRLYTSFQRQFIKIVEVILRGYLPPLAEKQGAASAATRLQGYLEEQAYRHPPKGSVLARHLESDHTL